MVSIILHRTGLVATILCLAVVLVACWTGVFSAVGFAVLVAVVLAVSALLVLCRAQATKQ